MRKNYSLMFLYRTTRTLDDTTINVPLTLLMTTTITYNQTKSKGLPESSHVSAYILNWILYYTQRGHPHLVCFLSTAFSLLSLSLVRACARARVCVCVCVLVRAHLSVYVFCSYRPATVCAFDLVRFGSAVQRKLLKMNGMTGGPAQE